ncbi:MAG: tetratricopeptide repeat protein [Nitrospirota bacterium]
MQGNYDDAVRNFNGALSLDPNDEVSLREDEVSLRGRGWSYFRKGDYAKAIKDFTEALKYIKPDNRFALKDALEGRSNAYYRKGYYDGAILDLNKLLELDPRHEVYLFGRGWSYFRRGNFEEALKDFNSFFENSKQNNKSLMQDAFEGKAFSYLGLGDSETAINLIKKSKEVLDYDISHLLSLIYYVMGDKEKAWQYRGGRGMIGVNIRDYTRGEIIGVEVVDTFSGDSAEKAGILKGDVIIKLNDMDIKGTVEFSKKIAVLIPGTTAKIKLLREGFVKDLTVKIESAELSMESDLHIAPIIAKRRAISKSERITIVVANLTASAFTHDEITPITANLRDALVKTGHFRVVSEEYMKATFSKKNFQKSEQCEKTGCLVEMGKLLGVEKVVGGTIGKSGNMVNISLRLVNVATGELEWEFQEKIKGKLNDLSPIINSFAKNLVSKYAITIK